MKKQSNDILNKVEEWIRLLVVVLMGLFAAIISVLSMFSTTYNIDGKDYFVADTPWKAILVYIVLVVGFAFCMHMKRSRRFACEAVSKYLQPVLLVAFFAFLIVFLMGLKLIPQGDQLAISNAAAEALHYDFTQFMKGNYFDFWPFQSRIVVFLIGLWRIVGENNTLAFQILNAIAITASEWLVLQTLKKFGIAESRQHRNIVLIGLVLFWPFSFFVTYVYGNVLGFACMCVAFYFMANFLEDYSVKNMILSAIFCGIGIWLKNTYLIMMIAMVVVMVMVFLQKKKAKCLIAAVLFMVCTFLFGKVSDLWLSSYMNMPIATGSPMISWITMGFGENENGIPVKYDAYNIHVYMDNDMDSAKAEEAATKELQVRLQNLTDSPMHFLRFMSRKIAMQWNEPTYDSIIVINKATKDARVPKWQQKMLDEFNTNGLIRFANLFQTVILLGVLTWVVLKGKKASATQLLFGIIFIGGFLFELFWETWASYALYYFFLLIPYGIMGYYAIAEYILEKPNKRKLLCGYGIPAVIVLLIAIAPLTVVKDLIKLDFDQERYTKDREEAKLVEASFDETLPNGFYRMVSYGNSSLGIMPLAGYSKDEEINRNTAVELVDVASDADAGCISVYHEYNYDLIRFKKTQCLLSFEETTVGQAYDNALWNIKAVPDKGFAVCQGDGLALTADGSRLSLEPFDGSDAQIWIFEK